MPKRFNQIANEAAAPAPDDVLALDGNVNGSRRLRAGRIQEWDSSRATAGYLWSDGATSLRAQVQIPGARGNLAGAPVASWIGWVDVPTSNSVSIFIATSGASSVGDNNGAYSLNLCINSAGTLEINAIGASGFSNRRVFQWTLFRATYSGQRVWLEVRLAKGTSNPVVRVNGADVSSSFSQATAGTPPEWLDAALVSTFHTAGGWWPTGPAPLGCWLNAHLSDPESESWRITGRPPAWVAAGGTFVTPANFTFVGAFQNGNVTNSGNSATGVTMTKTAGATGSLSVANAAIMGALGGNTFGSPNRRWRYHFTATFSSGTGTFTPLFEASSASGAAVSASGDYTGELYSAVNADLRWSFAFANASDACVVVISNFRLYPVGALSLPGVQSIRVLDDVTDIGSNQARLVGMAPITERRDWRIVNTTTSSGSSYIQLLGGALFSEPERHRIDSWVINKPSAGNATVSLSQSNSGGTYASAITATGAARTEVTLATRFPAAGQPNLWASSSTNDPITHTITGHRIGA